MATAFGRVMSIQRGESDELTKAAALVFSGVREGEKMSLIHIMVLLSEFAVIQ